MTYNDYVSLISRSNIGVEQFTPFLLSAYQTVVNRIKLDPLIIPIQIDKATVLDQFNSTAIMAGSISEIAFKEIIGWPKSVEYVDVSYNEFLDRALIGNDTLVGYGLDAEYYDDLGIYVNGAEITINQDSARLLVHGYMYPYFIRTIAGYKVDRHYYNPGDMVFIYAPEDLIVDDMLLYPVTLKALANAHLDQGNISLAGNYDKLCSEILNIYNKNAATMQFDATTAMAFTGGS